MEACKIPVSTWRLPAKLAKDSRKPLSNIVNTKQRDHRIRIVKPVCTRLKSELWSKKQVTQWNFPDPIEVNEVRGSVEERDPETLFPNYATDVLKYNLKLEEKFQIREHFLSKNEDLTSKHRAIAVDWIHQVTNELCECEDTFFRAVYLMDFFLQARHVKKEYLQIVAVVAVFLAAKYEESSYPSVLDLVYMTGEAVTKSQVFTMELLMLRVLNYDLGRPVPWSFIHRYVHFTQDKTKLVSWFLEMGAHSYKVAHVRPSLLATAACQLASVIYDTEDDVPFTPLYSEKHLLPVTKILAEVTVRVWKSNLMSVKSKYPWGSKYIPLVQDMIDTTRV